jgi:hypothetical protein
MTDGEMSPVETHLPLMWALEGDFELRAMMVSVDDTIQNVGRQLASFSVGRIVRGDLDDTYVVRLQGHTDALASDLTVRGVGLRPWDCIELSKSGKVARRVV